MFSGGIERNGYEKSGMKWENLASIFSFKTQKQEIMVNIYLTKFHAV